MYGAIAALIIALMMIAFVILKGHSFGGQVLSCRKSEFLSVTESFPDDCIIHVWIGRNDYEQQHRSAGRRNLRNNISE